MTKTKRSLPLHGFLLRVLYAIGVSIAFMVATLGDDAPRKTELESLRLQCEDILRQGVNEPLASDDRIERLLTISRFTYWPTKLVEDRLVDLVHNGDVETRIEAAEVLVEKTGLTHREEIVSSLKSSTPTRIEVAARQDILFFRLKLKSSARRVRAWAELDEAVIKQSWSCSMHPRIAALNNGKCPICGLDLVPNDQPSFEHRAAQRRALEALADNKDKEVPAYTRRILASSAECIWRVFAAGEWLRVAPKVAVPHVRVFLSSPQQDCRLFAIMSLSRYCPKDCVKDFKSIHESSEASEVERLYAAKGLVLAGHGEYLRTVRAFAARLHRKDGFLRRSAISVLRDCGSVADIELLVEYLESEDRQIAAAAILSILEADKVDTEADKGRTRG